MDTIWNALTSRFSLPYWLFGGLGVALAITAWSLRRPMLLLAALGLLALGTAAWAWLRWRRRPPAEAGAVAAQAEAPASAEPERPAWSAAGLRRQVQEAVETIRNSRLGQVAGKDALYELPWYLVIGCSGTGKSTVLARAGLNAPLGEQNNSQGEDGARACEWLFTSDAVLLDSAARFSEDEAAREEWLVLLDELRRNRPHLPINGVIVSVRAADVTGKAGLKNLRRNLRIQLEDITQRLGIHPPVYVMFTKADEIAGFSEFFAHAGAGQRSAVWGATLPYEPRIARAELARAIDAHLDALYQGLKEIGLARLAVPAALHAGPGLLAFPLDFRALRTALADFLVTLSEENPYQFRPLLRGFYFSSAAAREAGAPPSAAQVARRFGLDMDPEAPTPPATAPTKDASAYFLQTLFRDVLVPDRQMAKRFSTPAQRRLRVTGLCTGLLATGLLLAGWTWSYRHNDLLAMQTAGQVQAISRKLDAAHDRPARMRALVEIQELISQLRGKQPWWLGLGLSQNERMESKLLRSYYTGMRELMLTPVEEELKARLRSASQGSLAAERSTELFNALKTYLMLEKADRVDTRFLSGQLPSLWRGWLATLPGSADGKALREQSSILLAFYLEQAGDSHWPRLATDQGLVSLARTALRDEASDQGFQNEQVYQAIIRAANQSHMAFSPHVPNRPAAEQLLAASVVVQGAFTREAWIKSVRERIEQAAVRGRLGDEWVMGSTATSQKGSGSKDEIRTYLLHKYAEDYAAQWLAFLAGVRVKDTESLDEARKAASTLASSNSPLRTLLNQARHNTLWSESDAAAMATPSGGWLSRLGFGETAKPAAAKLVGESSSDVVRRKLEPSFAFLSTLTGPQGLPLYEAKLGKISEELGAASQRGDAGARELLGRILNEKGGSALMDAYQQVDATLLDGLKLDEPARSAVRPLLLNSLSGLCAGIVRSTENAVNSQWKNNVFPGYQELLEYHPFARNAASEASTDTINAVFGPRGSIASFGEHLKPLVNMESGAPTPRPCIHHAVRLAPEFVKGYLGWVAAFDPKLVNSRPSDGKSYFALKLAPPAGAEAYTVDVAGQKLEYPADLGKWNSMVWPPDSAPPRVRIRAKTADGREVMVLDETGPESLHKMVELASTQVQPDKSFAMSWTGGAVKVNAFLKLSDAPLGTAGQTRYALPADAITLGAPGAALAHGPAPSAAPVAANR
jgi:type VI secretion system protein ImpL